MPRCGTISIEAERQAEKGGAACGLMAMVNEGFWLTMNREVRDRPGLDQLQRHKTDWELAAGAGRK